MTREELLRILDYLDKMAKLNSGRAALADIDARWNIVAYTIRRHLQGKPLTITSLAAASGLPYGTAMRRIEGMVTEGLLMKRPRSKSGKSFSIHPTPTLIGEVEGYAAEIKGLIGSTFGFNGGDGSPDGFFFGGSYMAARILPYPSAMPRGLGYDRVVRILCNSDPTFKTLNEFTKNLREFCGGDLEILNLPLDDLREEILANATRKTSAYDAIAIDLPWIGEFASRGAILPLDGIIERENFAYADFHSGAWNAARHQGRQFGIPIQPTYELLFYRSDLFQMAGLDAPRTAKDVLTAASTLHRAGGCPSGIVMNYGRGTPVAHTFMQTKAAFGEPIVNLPRIGGELDFDLSDLRPEHYRPLIDTPIGRETAEFLLELRGFAHPQSLQCNWDKRIRIFAQGQAAMCYEWSIRAGAFELDRSSPTFGKVDFVPHPRGPEGRGVSPVGGFCLSIPANLGEERQMKAWRLIAYLTQPELMKWYAQNGSLVSPRFSTSADPEVRAMSPIISAVDAMEKRGELRIWPRPPIPEFHGISRVLGEEIFNMLSGRISPEVSLKQAQNRVDGVLRASGRY